MDSPIQGKRSTKNSVICSGVIPVKIFSVFQKNMIVDKKPTDPFLGFGWFFY